MRNKDFSKHKCSRKTDIIKLEQTDRQRQKEKPFNKDRNITGKLFLEIEHIYIYNMLMIYVTTTLCKRTSKFLYIF